MLKVTLIDGYGRGNKAKVNGEGELSAVIHPHPPKDESVAATPYRSYFLNGASSDMMVDGSTTPVVFEITANTEKDIYLKTISVSIVDASATLAKFGALAALSTGLDFIWDSNELGLLTIADQIKTNYDFTRISITPAVDSIASNVVGNAEGFTAVIDLEQVFGVKWGLRLRKATTDRLCFVVNDNLSTGMTSFDIIGYGFKF